MPKTSQLTPAASILSTERLVATLANGDTVGVLASGLPVSTAQASADSAVASAAASALASHTGNTSNPHSVTKTQVGLGNVDNTSDANKPVSTAQQAALDLKLDTQEPDFRARATNALIARRNTGGKPSELKFGDSLVNGASGFAYRQTFDPAWKRAFGDGGGGFIPFQVDQMAGLGVLCGATATALTSTFNPATVSWSQWSGASSAAAIAGDNRKHSFSGTGTYKVGASSTQKFYVQFLQPFQRVTLFYLEHTGSGQFQFGKDGQFTTVNCGGASVDTVKTISLDIWSGSFEDAIVGVVGVSGDIYIYGIMPEMITAGGINHLGGVGGIGASGMAALDETSFKTYIRTLAPAVATINLGTNDRSSATDGQLQGYLETIINRILAVDSTIEVLIQVPNVPGILTVFPTAFTAAAASTGAGLFYWKDFIGDNTDYLLPDAIHPNKKGTALLGRALFREMGGETATIRSAAWPWADWRAVPELVTTPSRNSLFTAAATDWAGTAGATVTLDTTNDELDVVNASGSTFRGATLSSSYFTTHVVGGLYYVRVEISAATATTIVLSKPGTVFTAINTGQRYFGAGQPGDLGGGACVMEYVFREFGTPTSTWYVVNEANVACSFSIRKFYIRRLDVVDKRIIPVGTTGAATSNVRNGSVNFAAAAQSLVVTNNLVSEQSVITATVATDDATALSVKAIPAAGSFTLKLNAAATAETRVNWHVTAP